MKRTLVIALCMLAAPAYAEFVDTPKADRFSALAKQLDELAQYLSLSEEDAILAKGTAAAWVYLGPCKRSSHDLPNVPADIVATAMTVNPKSQWGAAVMGMIGIMMKDDLGRLSDATCDFARAMALADR